MEMSDAESPQADTSTCNLCREDSEPAPATSWCYTCKMSLCDRCLTLHNRIPATCNHGVTELSGDGPVTKKRKLVCQGHLVPFESYCQDCKVSLCQFCSRDQWHKECHSITSMDSAVQEMRAFLETRKHTLDKRVSDETKLLDRRKSRCSEIQQTKSSIQSQIRSSAQRAMDTIKMKEKQLMDELDEITDKEMDQLITRIKSGDMAIQTYKQQSEFIDQALNSDSEVDMYALYQSCESLESADDTDVKDRGTRTRIEFSQDMDKMNKTLDELLIGKIQVIHAGVLDVTSKPVLVKTLDCKTPGEKHGLNIHDVKYMNINGMETIVISENNNRCMKSFYTRNNQARDSRLQLQCVPKQMAKLDDNKLVVINDDRSEILTVAVTPDLFLLSIVSTKKDYMGLTALTPTTLAACSQFPPTVDIIDTSGNILKSFCLRDNGECILDGPEFLCTTGKGNILVSDNSYNIVLCLTPEGEVVFKYQPSEDRCLRMPMGITSTGTGDILVADRLSHKVIQLCESGHFVRDVLTETDGVQWATAIDYSENGNLYISYMGESIQVFTFE